LTGVLLDTNVLLRTLQPGHPQLETVRGAIKTLAVQGRDLHIVPQILIELWVVATRPVEQNGLGLSPAPAAMELERLKSLFEFLPETAAVYPIWESLVTQYQVSGKPAHDAHLVATMRANSLGAILTFDRIGFSRYPGIEIIHPADVIAGAA
jgi:predicted nucleic acid-binding protein